MSEIKFRAFDKEKNIMICNSNQDWCHHYKSITPGVRILPVIFDIGYLYESLGQYTGLKDKNDKEIYEGDIISHKYSRGEYISEFESLQNRNIPPKVTPGLEIKYELVNYGEKEDIIEIRIPDFYIYLEKIRKGFCYDEIQEVCDHMEVIGNIYENSDLLEKNHER